MNKMQKVEIENGLRSIAKSLVEEAREANGCGWISNGDDIADTAAKQAMALIDTIICESI